MSPATNNFCVSATQARHSEIQKQVFTFFFESSKRIRDVILQRATPEKGTEVINPESTRRETEITKPESTRRESVTGKRESKQRVSSHFALQGPDDNPATNMAARRRNFQEIPALSTSESQVPVSLVHPLLNFFVALLVGMLAR
jgi:hypothetical protein